MRVVKWYQLKSKNSGFLGINPALFSPWRPFPRCGALPASFGTNIALLPLKDKQAEMFFSKNEIAVSYLHIRPVDTMHHSTRIPLLRSSFKLFPSMAAKSFNNIALCGDCFFWGFPRLIKPKHHTSRIVGGIEVARFEQKHQAQQQKLAGTHRGLPSSYKKYCILLTARTGSEKSRRPLVEYTAG